MLTSSITGARMCARVERTVFGKNKTRKHVFEKKCIGKFTTFIWIDM